MSSKSIRYYITLCVFVLVSTGLSALARDAGPRWVETARWSGSGTVYTEPFYVAGMRWRVKFYPDGPPPFDIHVCDAAANPVAKAAVAERALPGWRTFGDDPGYRILKIVGPHVQWTVTIEQLMTVREQWRLDRQQKKHVPVYKQIGVWSGEGPSAPVRFEVPIQDAPWRVVVQNEESGRLGVVLRAADGDKAVEANLQRAGTVESWGYGAGEYTLEVGEAETAWTVRLYAAGLSQ